VGDDRGGGVDYGGGAMSKVKQEYPLTGLPITRKIDGKVRNLSRLPDKTLERIEMLGEMNDRRKGLRETGNWRGLETLATEYAGWQMDTMAAHIRQEAYGIKASQRVSESTSQRGVKSARRGGQGRGVREAAKSFDVGAVGFSGKSLAGDAEGGKAGTRRAAGDHRAKRQGVSPSLE
jgi:hypothetical protein